MLKAYIRPRGTTTCTCIVDLLDCRISERTVKRVLHPGPGIQDCYHSSHPPFIVRCDKQALVSTCSSVASLFRRTSAACLTSPSFERTCCTMFAQLSIAQCHKDEIERCPDDVLHMSVNTLLEVVGRNRNTSWRQKTRSNIFGIEGEESVDTYMKKIPPSLEHPPDVRISRSAHMHHTSSATAEGEALPPPPPLPPPSSLLLLAPPTSSVPQMKQQRAQQSSDSDKAGFTSFRNAYPRATTAKRPRVARDEEEGEEDRVSSEQGEEEADRPPPWDDINSWLQNVGEARDPASDAEGRAEVLRELKAKYPRLQVGHACMHTCARSCYLASPAVATCACTSSSQYSSSSCLLIALSVARVGACAYEILQPG